MNSTAKPAAPSASEIRRLLGDVPDAKVVAIAETGASLDEIEQALAWEEGETDVLGEQERPLTGAVGRVYEILTAEENWAEADRSGG